MINSNNSRSIDALGNLNGFFDNLATNIHTMESRNLLPNQMRLLGETENRPRENYGHSAAFINSVSFSSNSQETGCLIVIFQLFLQVRAYQSPKNIRMLMNYQPGINSCKNLENSSPERLKCEIQISYPLIADTHRNSNFYDPVLSRIGLGK